MNFFKNCVFLFGEIWTLLAMLIFVTAIAFILVGSQRMAVIFLMIFILEAAVGFHLTV